MPYCNCNKREFILYVQKVAKFNANNIKWAIAKCTKNINQSKKWRFKNFCMVKFNRKSRM